MNISRGTVNKLVAMARQLSGETHYLMVWQNVDRPEVYQYCVTTNSGSASTLLLEFEEVDSAIATDAEVTLQLIRMFESFANHT